MESIRSKFESWAHHPLFCKWTSASSFLSLSVHIQKKKKKKASIVNSCQEALTGIPCKQHHSWLFLLVTGFLFLRKKIFFCSGESFLSLPSPASVSSPSPFSCFWLSPCDSLSVWFSDSLPLVLPCLSPSTPSLAQPVAHLGSQEREAGAQKPSALPPLGPGWPHLCHPQWGASLQWRQYTGRPR